MKGERGQSLIEAVVALPVCVACAMAIVDCGVLVRDRVAVAQAAARAAEAHLQGRSELDAARGALPAGLSKRVHVRVEEHRVVVSAPSGARIAKLAGRTVTSRSTAAFDVAEAAR
ncbi:MAG: hypothetical protein JWM98_3204 [Thermoleophilia bacterium]|nr:hypothetical protein [Thermoleophilia bacterium]